jgi:hypothetical protein
MGERRIRFSGPAFGVISTEGRLFSCALSINPSFSSSSHFFIN